MSIRIEFAGGDINLYAYVSNNPVTFFDPEGTQGRSDRNFYPNDKDPKTGKGYGIYRDPVPPGCPVGGWGLWVTFGVTTMTCDQLTLYERTSIFIAWRTVKLLEGKQLHVLLLGFSAN